MSFIVLSEDKAKVVKEVVQAEIPISEFFKSIRDDRPFIYGMLPQGTKTVFHHRGNYGFIVEIAPTLYHMGYSANKNKEVINYAINIPWVYMGVAFVEKHFSDLYMVGAANRVTKNTDRVFAFPFPNVRMADFHGRVCMGSISISQNAQETEMIEEVLTKFWASTFNSDYFGVGPNSEDLPPILADAAKAKLRELQDLYKEAPPNDKKDSKSLLYGGNIVLHGWEELSKTMQPEIMSAKFTTWREKSYEDFVSSLAINIGALRVFNL